MNKTLYAFGDSFCRYFWPMWPEIMGQCFQDFKNLGEPGCGNYRIFQKFNECLPDINNLDVNNSTVIVQWTDPCRFDSFDKNYVWLGLGEESAEVFYTNKKLYHLNSEELTVIKQLSYMVSVANFLHLLGIDWYYIFLNKASYVQKYEFKQNNIAHTIHNLQCKLAKFKDRIIDTDNLTSHMKKIKMPEKNCSYNGEPPFRDLHPTPIFTYSFIKENLSSKIENLNNDKMLEYSKRIQNIIESTRIKKTYFLTKTHTQLMEHCDD